MSDLTLGIETSNPAPPLKAAQAVRGAGGAGSVCVGRRGTDGTWEVLSHRALSPASRHDDALMPAVEAACVAAGVRPGELRRVAVSIGPGGFTSTRIGVTTAKMICEATGAACIGVPTALAVAWGARAAGLIGTVGVLLAWKREDVWRQRFELARAGVGVPARALGEGGIVALSGATDACDAVVCDGALAALLPVASGCPTHPAGFDAGWVLEASDGLVPTDAAQLLAIYPREPEAVTKWRLLRPPRA